MALGLKQFSDLITFTRSGTGATRTNSAGQIEEVAANTPRFDYDPATLLPRGILIEDAGTNLLLNSLVTGDNLSTQSVTVEATPYTISFYGTGTVTLSDAFAATVVGSAVYPTRTSLTFTPTAGSLTVTVSGTVQFAQLETGSTPTSFVPTGASAVKRSRDSCIISGANFSQWYSQTGGTFILEGQSYLSAFGQTAFELSDGATSNIARASSVGGPTWNFSVTSGSVAQVSLNASPNASPLAPFKMAAAMALDDVAFCANGGTVAVDTSALLPAGLDQIAIGSRRASSGMYGWVKSFRYIPKRLSNSELQAATV